MNETLLAELNDIAENLVLFNSVDLSFLGQAYRGFAEAAAITRKNNDETLAQIFDQLYFKTEKIILDQYENPIEEVKFLGTAVAKISAMTRGDSTLEQTGLKALLEKQNPPAEKNAQPEIVNYITEFIAAVNNDAETVHDFLIEAGEHIGQSNDALLELEKNQNNDEMLNLVFRCFHSIKGVAGFLNLGTIQHLAHHAENVLDKMRSHELKLTSDLSDLLFETLDTLKLFFADLNHVIKHGNGSPSTCGGAELIVRLDSYLTDTPIITDQKEHISAPSTAPAITEFIDEPKDMENPGSMLPAITQPTEQTSVRNATRDVVKVDAERLNRLIDSLGELVIAGSMVTEAEELRNTREPSFMRKVNQLNKITRELQELGMTLRMVTVKSTFNTMARLVRDLARKLQKEVEFVTAGEETEIDKSIVDKIGDPLVHLVRNAIDHGIENTQEERVKAGKSPVARVELRAFQRAGSIYIEIEDDGRGINTAKVYAKAVEKGLIKEGTELSESEICKLIFAPGFSTVDKVSDVSGRGVGMDVVRRNIEDLNGVVEITTRTGKGTTFTIKLPLTLAIIDGMAVRVSGEQVIVPTLTVARVIQAQKEAVHSLDGHDQFIMLQGQSIPVFHLNEFLELPKSNNTEHPSHYLIMIVATANEDGGHTGFIIDELLGKQQIVIKNLGETFQHVAGYSGCAILPDGTVGLILDMNGIIKYYRQKQL